MKPFLAAAAILATGLAPLQAQQSLAGAYLYTPPTCSSSPFSDVTAGDSYCPWIKQLKTDGITTGCGGGAFCPDAPVTHEQLALMLERAMHGTADWEPWEGIFKRTLIVSPIPGDTAASGQRLVDVIASITSSSSTNSYLVLVEPGFYDLGAQHLEMPPYTTLAGAGPERTRISTSTPGAAIVGDTEVVIDGVYVTNDGPGSQVIGIDLGTINGGTVRNVRVSASNGISSSMAVRCVTNCLIEDVEVTASGPTSNTGIYVVNGAGTSRMRRVRAKGFAGDVAQGIYLASSSAFVEDSYSEAVFSDHNYAIVASDSTAFLRNVEAVATPNSASVISAGLRIVSSANVTVENSRLETDTFGAGDQHGLLCSSGDASVHNSRVLGATSTVLGSPSCEIDIAASQLGGPAVDPNGGTVRCALNYSENLNVPATTGCF